MKQLAVILLLVQIFCNNQIADAQVAAPTLSAGLTSLTLEKGQIDVALLSEIIADKQEELRKELLQRHLLAKMEYKGFALQNYLYSSFHALLTLKDYKAIEKELLSQITILALQLGFGEALLRISFNQSTLSKGLHTALLTYLTEQYPQKSVDELELSIHGLHKDQSLNHRLFLMFHLDKRLLNVFETAPTNPKLPFSALLLDNIYEAMRLNQTLNNIGFIKMHPNLVGAYNKISQYDARKTKLDGLYQILSQTMDLLVRYHPLFADFINDENLTIEELFNESQSNRISLNTNDLGTRIDSLTNYIDTIQIKLSQRSSNVSIATSELEGILHGLWDFRKRTMAGTEISKLNINDYTFLVETVEPFFADGMSKGLFGKNAWTQLQKTKIIVYQTLVDRVRSAINAAPDVQGLLHAPISEYGHLIRIITSLSQLDKVSAYEHLFNTMAQIGINNLDRTELVFLKDIIYFLEAHTAFDSENQRIQVSVEALLLRILERYQNQVGSNLGGYFSIGIGQTFATNYSEGFEITNSDNQIINNLSMASEKIGIKYKFINNRKKRSTLLNNDRKGSNLVVDGYTEKPIVSDYYLFGFGSGLLYNVANLTSAGKTFDYAQIGLGAGVAFFNALDLNIWMSAPISSGESLKRVIGNRGFYGFSFEVKLTEYLNELAKKRRQNRAMISAQ